MELKVIVLVLGNMLAALGVALCVLAGKGVDPLTVLFQGVCRLTGLEMGVVALGINIILIIFCLSMDRSSIKLGTIISMFTFSMFLNLFIKNIGNVMSGTSPIHLWIYLICGIILMGIGFSTCIVAGIGPNCLDVVLEILMNRTNLNMKACKSMVDLISASLGVMLGARFGIGTVLCVCFVGMIYTMNMRMLDRIPFRR